MFRRRAHGAVLPWRLLPLIALVALFGPARADAAVAFRASACATANVASSISLTTPASTQIGDVLIATVVSDDGHSTPASPSPTTGWTQINSWTSGLSAASLYYRLATANGSTSYTFSMNAAAATSASIAAYSGADSAAPIGGTLPVSTDATGSGTSVALPNATVAAGRSGSMRVSVVQRISNVTSSYPGTMTESCDQGFAVGTLQSSTSSGNEVATAGTTPSRTATLSASATWFATTFIIQAPPCSAGGTAAGPPSTISFTPVTLNGANQTTGATGHVTIDDETAGAPGWNLSATSTTFANGGNVLSSTATTVTAVGVSALAGSCSLPVSAITYPVTLPAGATAPPAAKVFNAGLGSGLGGVDLGFTFQLKVPANARIGSYTSTWTFTVATGP